ncbi:hypothetical protein BH18ACT2_BH18ACT2_00800 [soil metagenome]
MLEVDPQLLAERTRLGLDRHDEMWDGELHMVPPPSGPHQSFAAELAAELRGLARQRGPRVTHETGLFRNADDYRVPISPCSVRTSWSSAAWRAPSWSSKSAHENHLTVGGDAERERTSNSAMSERTVLMVRSLEDSLPHRTTSRRPRSRGTSPGDAGRC